MGKQDLEFPFACIMEIVSNQSFLIDAKHSYEMA